jgi:hypothetical protein
MTHPSIQRAREVLSRRDRAEIEHKAWQADHFDELSDARLAELYAQRREQQRLIYKTHDNGPPPQADLRNEFTDVIEDLRAFALEAACVAAEECGAKIADLESRMEKIERSLIERGLRLLKNDAA